MKSIKTPCIGLEEPNKVRGTHGTNAPETIRARTAAKIATAFIVINVTREQQMKRMDLVVIVLGLEMYAVGHASAVI